MLILSIDPGNVTGIATYNTDTGEFGAAELIAGHKDLVSFVTAADHVVVEDFTISKGTAEKTQQKEALLEIGRIKGACVAANIEPHMQARSAKRYGADKLKVLGWHNVTKDHHADDAAAHLVRYLLKERLMRAEDLKKIKGLLS